ncbi:hypothetical protein CYLTODRAFT_369962 [Cylindrobasidium torrendii FP15055 ss-10]|uniref:Nucleoside phosphatase GDA1/CD39 n=1 Tax=Cylindrobasidium torrendii FP15055 ss-10 TaxID=1314674 RepID=A0A0D7BKF7_9AGAR|nr:hypothetical protein CYLTODRAFT_369962 [Cylindrobasidium torrendii FP15055 ss-10]
MPPPTANDAWLAGRHFGVVIDAGSSGSRVQIYSWRDPKLARLENTSDDQRRLPAVDKGTRNGEGWYSKVEPGISSFADHTADLPGYLRPLLSHAQEQVPPSLHSETPIFLLATAGMRLLTPEQQAEILLETCHFFSHHSHFKLDAPNEAGPCGASVRIITGEEEGLFGWIAVNYLMDGFTGGKTPTTYGFLDMGGASTQIAFEPNSAHQDSAKSLVDVSLRLLNGEEIVHKVFVTTWLGYGTNQARERYVGDVLSEFERSRPADTTVADLIEDPCLPKDLTLVEKPVHAWNAPDHLLQPHRLVGTGSFEQCLEKTSVLLNKNAPCPDTTCLMNGIYVPPIDFSVSHFIGVSEYWYSSDHVFNLGGAYDYVQYERAASNFCSRNWVDIVAEHDRSRTAEGNWGPNVEISRLQMQCFKAAWIANVLHEGIGMPRIVDPGGNGTTHGERVAEEADKKGLGPPTFQSVDTVGDIAISWTLGKMVLEASKEVPVVGTGRPIGDPLDHIVDTDHPIQPIRIPWMSLLEDKITPHLPSSLTRSSLGFSPIIPLFWMMVFIAVLLSYPLRRRLRTNCLRSIRLLSRSNDATDLYNMEEAKTFGGFSSRPPSPTSSAGKSISWFKPFRRILSSGAKAQPRRSPSIPSSPVSPSAPRMSPRSYSFPSALNIAPPSRSSSPSPGAAPADEYYSPRRISQSGLAARPMSRVNSSLHLSDTYQKEYEE